MPPVLCAMEGSPFFAPFERDSAPDEKISTLQKMESAPHERNPGHTSGGHKLYTFLRT